MSADNGVYIAEFRSTKFGSSHFRVIHAQCIDDISYVWEKDGEKAGKEVVKGFYDDAPSFADLEVARKHAWEIYEELAVCEYGVCSIGTFEDIF
jgi:hypothetical protein